MISPPSLRSPPSTRTRHHDLEVGPGSSPVAVGHDVWALPAIGLYAIATTMHPSMRGRGLGRRLKERLVQESRDHYSYVAGRTRVGRTDAMTHINRALGAYEVARIDQAYADGGTCLYYRLPL